TPHQVIERREPILPDSAADARRRARYMHKVSPDPVAKNAVVTHREIIHYMRLGDAEGAAVAMAYHIKRAMLDLEL
ncbi:MAG: hypothetical protein LIP28_10720, partial [Deltaproteobacteria bacterium]|nr:hypothetical protein [Deltaproteobacteria bacterium]